MILPLLALLALEPAPTAPRGLASSITIEPKGPPLIARPIAADQHPPVIVRIEPPDASGRQRVEFIGLVAGEHDLGDFLMRTDGAAPSALGPLTVRIESRLPSGNATDVLGLAEPNLSLGRGYGTTLAGIVTIWALVPAVAYVRRRLNRPAFAPPPPPTPEPTLAEQLLAMLESWNASDQGLERQAALELLALHHQRSTVAERDEAIATAMIRARRDDRTREVVLALEAWLHAGTGDPAAAREAALARLREIVRREGPTPGGQGP
ncbi:MAG: hypothetical protein WCK33_04110 [Phycisphaerae bacterium]